MSSIRDQISRNPLRLVLKGVIRYLKKETALPPKTAVYSSGGGSGGSDDYMTNPMTAIGDIIYGTTAATPSEPGRLGIGATGQVLTVVAGLPDWENVILIKYHGQETIPVGLTIVDIGAIADDYWLHDVWVKVITLDGMYYAENRPNAPELGGITYMIYKDSGNLKIAVSNDMGNDKIVAITYT